MTTSELIINPFARITSFENNGNIEELRIEIPIPNQSKKVFQLKFEENPDLVEFISDLNKWGFQQFDPNDLTRTEMELLQENGFLVAKNSAPKKPLFNCFLDEIEPKNSASLSPANLIVNPSFRFESFDLTKASQLIHINNFSPYFPIAWVRLPITEIEIGYWLRDEYVEIVQNFKAGEKSFVKIEPGILSKLVEAGILIEPNALRKIEAKVSHNLEEAHQIYIEKKYVVLEQILPSYYISSLQNFFRQYVSNGFMPFDDGQVKRRYYQHNLPIAQFFHHSFTRLMSKIVGIEVKPSYVYAASYIEDADLAPHLDREQCEYSISFQVDYLPEPENGVSPWGLYVSPLKEDQSESINLSWDEFPEDNSTNQEVMKINLKNGDGLVYKGRELIHYRYKLPKNHQSTSLFFHYVAHDYQGQLS